MPRDITKWRGNHLQDGQSRRNNSFDSYVCYGSYWGIHATREIGATKFSVKVSRNAMWFLVLVYIDVFIYIRQLNEGPARHLDIDNMTTNSSVHEIQ